MGGKHVLAGRIRDIAMSPTFRINAEAREMRARGIDVLDFSVAEPDSPTPRAANKAGKLAIDRDLTRYTANEGILELREAICEKLRRENGLDYGPEEILVSPGAKASLYFAAMALFEEGDEVLIPSPYWVSYPEQIRLSGARPILVPTREENDFKLTPSDLRGAASSRTRGLILNYPANPTGSCYDRAELERLAAACLDLGILVVADEIYEKLLYDGGRFTSIASLGPEIHGRTVVVNGMSKAFAMTGWRIGYAAGPREIIGAMAKLQSHSTSHPASMAQWASVDALSSAGQEVTRMAREFEHRRDELLPMIAGIPGWSCVRPVGAFYVFPNVSALFGTPLDGAVCRSGEDLALFLLEKARVAVVPGEAFGSPRHIRISYACSLDQIRKGMDRIAEALAPVA